MPDWTQVDNAEPPADLSQQPGLMVLDARIELHGLQAHGQALPALALRPYPSELVAPVLLSQEQDNGGNPPAEPTLVTLRPAGPNDEGLLSEFLERLSDQKRVFANIATCCPRTPGSVGNGCGSFVFWTMKQISPWSQNGSTPLNGTSEIVAICPVRRPSGWCYR